MSCSERYLNRSLCNPKRIVAGISNFKFESIPTSSLKVYQLQVSSYQTTSCIQFLMDIKTLETQHCGSSHKKQNVKWVLSYPGSTQILA